MSSKIRPAKIDSINIFKKNHIENEKNVIAIIMIGQIKI